MEEADSRPPPALPLLGHLAFILATGALPIVPVMACLTSATAMACLGLAFSADLFCPYHGPPWPSNPPRKRMEWENAFAGRGLPVCVVEIKDGDQDYQRKREPAWHSFGSGSMAPAALCIPLGLSGMSFFLWLWRQLR